MRRISHKLLEIDAHGFIVTAKGENSDFVSRFFAPEVGVFEDPVTGSAHCNLIPYWAEKLGKTEMFARQISAARRRIILRTARRPRENRRQRGFIFEGRNLRLKTVFDMFICKI